MQHRFVSTTLLMLALAGCSRPAVVTIANRSPVTITNVVVSGSGFSKRIERIPPDSELELSVRPQGKSGIRISFDASGPHIAPREQGYFESGYRVKVTIEPDLQVLVASDVPAS